MRQSPESEAGRGMLAGAATHDSTPRLRAYSRPQLVEYGPLAKLTQGTPSGDGEITPTGVKRMMCL